MLAGLVVGNRAEVAYIPEARHLSHVVSPNFFASLMLVHYSFSGWNTSLYIFRELKNERTVYLSLFLSIGIVSVLYVLLNTVFILCLGIPALRGVTEVGHVVAVRIFGWRLGAILSSCIGFLLIANISSMLWAGSRIAKRTWEIAMQEKNDQPVSVIHLLMVVIVSLVFIWFNTFISLLTFTSFLLSCSSVLVVLGLFTNASADQPRGVDSKTKLAALFFCTITAISSFYILFY